MYTNADGLVVNGIELKDQITENKPAIVGVVLTKLNKGMKSNLLSLEGYMIVREGRRQVVGD